MSGGIFKKDNINIKKAYFTGGIIGVLLTLALMLFFSALLLFFNIDRDFAAPFATISVAIGGFVSSYIIAKKIKDNGYIIGAINGFVLFFVITLISLILGNSLTLNTLFHFIIFMLSSMVGGIVGVNKNNRYI